MGRGRRASHARPTGPQRRCVGCRQPRPQGELLRLTAAGGVVVADAARTAPGRGCYLCRDPRCAARATKGRQISRALKGKVAEPAAGEVLGWLGLPAGGLTA